MKTKQKLKILLQNVDTDNKGNFALTLSTISTIKEFIPEAEFYLMGRKGGYIKKFEVKKPIGYKREYNEKFLNKLKYYLYYLISSVYYLIISSLIYLLNKFGIKIKINEKSPLFYYSNCDVIVDIGGDSLSGEYNISVIPIIIDFIYGLLLNKPIVLYGASLGYFKSSTMNFIVKSILNQTKLILLRENKSKKYLDENKVNKPIIRITADPAFNLKSISKEHLNEILVNENIYKIKKPLWGVNPSGLIGEFKKNQSSMDLNTIIAHSIDYLIEKYDINVLLIPHVYSSSNDDRKSIKKIYAILKNKSNVEIIRNEYSPDELKGIIGLCDLLVAARMHATIASTSMSIPTIVLSYSHKTTGIIGDLLGQETYVLDINDLNYKKLLSKIDDAWGRREEIREELMQRVPEIKEKACLNGKLVKEFLDQTS